MSLYEIKTPFGIPVIARDAPKRVTPPLANLEATLAAMKADAVAWKARKGEAWGENMAVGNAPLSRDQRFCWTEQRHAALRAEVLRVIAANPQSRQIDILALIRECNRHKLRDTLTALRKEGLIDWVQIGGSKVWSLV